MSQCHRSNSSESTRAFHKSWEETKTKTTNAINNAKLWLDNNKLTLNKTKTEIMTFSLKANGQP